MKFGLMDFKIRKQNILKNAFDTMAQESRREGMTDARLAVGFCLGSGLFGSYNSD